MQKLVAEAEIAIDHPERIVGPVCEHLVEHGASVDRDGEAWTLTWPQAQAWLHPRAGLLYARAEADNAEALYLLRLGIASHVVEFAEDDALQIRWTGAGGDITVPPNYRLTSVAKVETVTPHMRRVTLVGDDLERFMTDEALHLKLLVPPRPGAPLHAPSVGPDGLVRWPQGEDAPLRRTYTVRRFDRSAGTIDVDFVLHDDAGPGSRWATEASLGDRIGIMGPGGGGVPRVDDILLAGDETALPAISRILEALPEAARGVAVVEVADAAERQTIEKPDGVDLIWLLRHRSGVNLREEVLRHLQNQARATFFWTGSEFDTFKAIRGFVRKELKTPKEQHLVVSYWRRGTSETAVERN